jgi:hypothetical protein
MDMTPRHTPSARARETDQIALWPVAMALLPTGVCVLAELALRVTGRLSTAVLVLVLVLLDPLLFVAFRWISHMVLEAGDRGVQAILAPQGGAAPTPSYSVQEAMVARGDFTSAVTMYRAWIDQHPDDIEARLRLAALFESLHDDDRAEACYRAISTRNTSRALQARAMRGLIDLYQRVGARDKLKIELGRFARQWEGTRDGTLAREQLRELTREDFENSG